MDYPIVYDKFEKDFTKLGLAILENAKEIKVREQINGEYLLSLILPRNDPKWQYVQSENFIKVESQLYRIRTTEETRDKTGRIKSNIQCEHVWYDANDCKFIPFFRMIGKTPREILEEAFSGTRFVVGDVNITTATDIELSKTNPSKVTQKLIENVGGELYRDNWTVNLLEHRGNNNGVHIRVGKNLDTVKRTSNSQNLITRLYPYGKDDMDITSVNNDIAYLDSPLAGLYDRLHIDNIDYKDIEDPTKLKTEALKEFSTAEKDGIDKPKITYEMEVQELKKLTGFRFVTFGIGDIVRVIDETLGVDINAEILEYEYYPFEPIKSNVVLGNFRENIDNFLADLVRSKQHLTDITDSRGNIKADFVEYLIGKLSTEINAAIGSKKVVVHDYGDIWVDNLDNPTKAMCIINGMFAIANSKKDNGDWNWRVLGTGDKLVADAVIANWVYAGKITAQQIDVSGGKITAGQIDATSLHVNSVNVDGKLKAAQIETSELVVGTNIAMGAAATIGWSQVTNQPTIISQDTVTQISRNEIATATIKVNQLLMGGENGSISFNSLSDKPSIPSQYTDAQALAAWVASKYKTYIDDYGLYTGTVMADKIIGNQLKAINSLIIGETDSSTKEIKMYTQSGQAALIRASGGDSPILSLSANEIKLDANTYVGSYKVLTEGSAIIAKFE